MARRRSTQRSGSAALAGWWNTTKAQDVVTQKICACDFSEVGAELWVSRQGAISKDGVRQGLAPSDVIIPVM